MFRVPDIDERRAAALVSNQESTHATQPTLMKKDDEELIRRKEGRR